ncbi:MAG: metal ABC transporter permease [Synergistaceae bacterium]|nr:metal ABC transporter permease [Synergistaceae bacterium]
MIKTIAEMFSYTFLVRAVVVGLMVSLCASLLGVSLVLKRYSMIGDGLSHVGFGSLAVAMAMNAAPLAVSIPVVLLAAFLLLKITENSKIRSDAAIALISTGSLAVGVMVISMTTGMNTDVCNFLFGSILAMSKADVYLSVVLSAVVLALFIIFYNRIFAVTFDETFARATGVRVGLYNTLLAFLSAVTIVLGMRMMGAMLISSLIIFPALSSMRVFKKFKTVVVSSAVISVACFMIGTVISYEYATPTGASVVCVNMAAFGLCCAAGFAKTRKSFVSGAVLVLLVCSAAFAEDVFEIREKMFVAQTNDVYLNPDEYMGRTIRLEGIFGVVDAEENEPPCYYVYRFGPGCCGYDANAGFEVVWDARNGDKGYPDDNEWAEATGVLESYEYDGDQFLRLSLSSLVVKAERGKERVEQ